MDGGSRRDGGTYDVAVSFAGEDRPFVARVVAELGDRGVSVYYDQDREAEEWGLSLPEVLDDTYGRRAFRVLMFVSHAYATKAYPTHERRSALARAVSKPQEPYILPVRFDDTPIPGVNPGVKYLDASGRDSDWIADRVVDHLKAYGRIPRDFANRYRQQFDQASRVAGGAIVSSDQDGRYTARMDIANAGDYPITNVVAVISDPGANNPPDAVEQMQTAGEIVVGTLRPGEHMTVEFDHLHFSDEPVFAQLTTLGYLLFTDRGGVHWAVYEGRSRRMDASPRIC